MSYIIEAKQLHLYYGSMHALKGIDMNIQERKVTALIGTHTHVQTADERIIGGFTAYMTDAGMVGAVPSVIGGDPQTSVDRQLTMMPVKMEPAEGSCVIQGVLTEADAETGRALSVGRFSEPVF